MTANQSNQRFAGFPQFNAPFVDRSGNVSQAWQWFLTAMWQKNGSSFSEVPNAAYPKQQPGLPITMHDAQTGDMLGQMLTGLQIVLPTDEFTVTETTDANGNPNFTVVWNPQGANTVFAGPGSGADAVPTFRLLVPADLPIATTSDVGAVKPDGTTITILPDGTISATGGGGGGYAPGTPPTVVQVAWATSAVAATFGSPPTSGNLFVAMAFNSANDTITAGWTKQVEDGSGTDWGDILTKPVGVAEPSLQQPMAVATANGGVVIWELAGANAVPFVFGQSQPEQSGAFATPVLLPNVFNCLGLSAVSVITPQTIASGFNVGTQDVLDNTGNRKLFAGHTDLGQTPMAGVMASLSASGSSKGATCLITS
jgi:hypothetical protein